MKMSKSDAGKLGGIKAGITAQDKMQQRIDNYNKSPVVCAECGEAISYEKRFNKFCCSSCAASFNNKKRESKFKDVTCLNCGVHLNKKGKYCSIKCQQEHFHYKRVDEWKNGVSNSKASIKRFLTETYGNKCSVCGITEWNGKSITFELEHKDGNSENNTEENLCLICPNCHSQTDTYKGKNKGNGRYYRRVRYQEGKSF